MQKYVCDVCGYIYDPHQGDPDGGVKPGTPLAKVSDEWSCPQCGAVKAEFSALEQQSESKSAVSQ